MIEKRNSVKVLFLCLATFTSALFVCSCVQTSPRVGSQGSGWQSALTASPWTPTCTATSIPAYSEQYPVVFAGGKPYGGIDSERLDPADPFGFKINEYEQAFELTPGLEVIACQLVDSARTEARTAPGAGPLVILTPLNLSLTENSEGIVRWTVFPCVSSGALAELAFWNSFYLSPGVEVPSERVLLFFQSLLGEVYGQKLDSLADLKSIGFRTLPRIDEIPAWAKGIVLSPEENVDSIRYLLTFKSLESLPEPVRNAYAKGKLAIIPTPAALDPNNSSSFHPLNLLQSVREECPIRIPQAGSFDMATPEGREVWSYLFCADAEKVNIYEKPLGVNSGIWSVNGTERKLIFDGATASEASIQATSAKLLQGGRYEYCMDFRPAQLGRGRLAWALPVAAYLPKGQNEPKMLSRQLTGYFHIYQPNEPIRIKLWPRILHRELDTLAINAFSKDGKMSQSTLAIRRLLDAWRLLGEKPLPRPLAGDLAGLEPGQTLDDWMESLVLKAHTPAEGKTMVEALSKIIAPPETLTASLSESITFNQTATRQFETAYWSHIQKLSTDFKDKCAGDPAKNPPDQPKWQVAEHGLDKVADYIKAYYQGEIAKAGMEGKAFVGDMSFPWRTRFDYSWLGGWKSDKDGKIQQRNIITVIPGRDRSRAVVLSDHYDTAYMDDVYAEAKARVAAQGADDNGSAVACLMSSAPVFLELARQGRLECDVWLAHLTCEEFPADSQGAGELVRQLVERKLSVDCGGRSVDLSGARVEGVFLMDMIAHNEGGKYIFSICPGEGAASMRLAAGLSAAADAWNRRAAEANKNPERQTVCPPRTKGPPPPPTAPFATLNGVVLPSFDPKTSMGRTDCQVMSDFGIPVVLSIEANGLDRKGYHDLLDTMELIDLDYGSAMAAVVIEAAARAACAKP